MDLQGLRRRVLQINVQPHVGGGETYTVFFSQALLKLGQPTALWRHPQAGFWPALGLPASVVCVTDLAQALDLGSKEPLWWLGHGPLPRQVLDVRPTRPHDVFTAIAHMPVQGRDPTPYVGHDVVFPVSEWVAQGLRDQGLPTWSEPLYGVAKSKPQGQRLPVRQRPVLEPDPHKPRDRLLAGVERAALRIQSPKVYSKRPGLTLGVVSRITPIKQFPALFSALMPVLERHPSVNLEIFGAGGYGSVRDLKRVLAPLGDRVRFWGHQSDVYAVYDGLDVLLTGLPEKEALGLNVIEASAAGLPVWAVNAPPFTETVRDGVNGHLYTDPRADGGADFERLLTLSASGALAWASDADRAAFAARFSMETFEQRVRKALVQWGHQMKESS